MCNGLTHLDRDGRARMVDVSAKDRTDRTAVAVGRIFMQPTTLREIAKGSIPKGDVFAVARIAGIMAAKNTANMMPLCHPLSLSSVKIELAANETDSCVDISATCSVSDRTGVEMESLAAVSIAALTIYDMCKAIDRDMVIGDVCLVEKRGGRTGSWQRER